MPELQAVKCKTKLQRLFTESTSRALANQSPAISQVSTFGDLNPIADSSLDPRNTKHHTVPPPQCGYIVLALWCLY